MLQVDEREICRMRFNTQAEMFYAILSVLHFEVQPVVPLIPDRQNGQSMNGNCKIVASCLLGVDQVNDTLPNS